MSLNEQDKTMTSGELTDPDRAIDKLSASSEQNKHDESYVPFSKFNVKKKRKLRNQRAIVYNDVKQVISEFVQDEQCDFNKLDFADKSKLYNDISHEFFSLSLKTIEKHLKNHQDILSKYINEHRRTPGSENWSSIFFCSNCKQAIDKIQNSLECIISKHNNQDNIDNMNYLLKLSKILIFSSQSNRMTNCWKKFSENLSRKITESNLDKYTDFNNKEIYSFDYREGNTGFVNKNLNKKESTKLDGINNEDHNNIDYSRLLNGDFGQDDLIRSEIDDQGVIRQFDLDCSQFRKSFRIIEKYIGNDIKNNMKRKLVKRLYKLIDKYMLIYHHIIFHGSQGVINYNSQMKSIDSYNCTNYGLCKVTLDVSDSEDISEILSIHNYCKLNISKYHCDMDNWSKICECLLKISTELGSYWNGKKTLKTFQRYDIILKTRFKIIKKTRKLIGSVQGYSIKLKGLLEEIIENNIEYPEIDEHDEISDDSDDEHVQIAYDSEDWNDNFTDDIDNVHHDFHHQKKKIQHDILCKMFMLLGKYDKDYKK